MLYRSLHEKSRQKAIDKDAEEHIVQILAYQFVTFLQLNDIRFILCND